MNKYINAPMLENDAGAATIKEYLRALLLTLWREKDGFSSKRPFGNSGWECEIISALIKCAAVGGEVDSEGFITHWPAIYAVDRCMEEIINAIFDAAGEDKSYELAPCPHCGGSASLSIDPDGTRDAEGRLWAYTVVCDRCCATSGLCWSPEMAYEAWNRRAE